MGLLFSLLLCLINIFNSTMQLSPNNARAITHWILLCILFVILAILEYALLIAYKKYKKRPKVEEISRLKPHDEVIENLSKRINRLMIVIFPPVFAVFSLTYWTNWVFWSCHQFLSFASHIQLNYYKLLIHYLFWGDFKIRISHN